MTICRVGEPRTVPIISLPRGSRNKTKAKALISSVSKSCTKNKGEDAVGLYKSLCDLSNTFYI